MTDLGCLVRSDGSRPAQIQVGFERSRGFASPLVPQGFQFPTESASRRPGRLPASGLLRALLRGLRRHQLSQLGTEDLQVRSDKDGESVQQFQRSTMSSRQVKYESPSTAAQLEQSFAEAHDCFVALGRSSGLLLPPPLLSPVCPSVACQCHSFLFTFSCHKVPVFSCPTPTNSARVSGTCMRWPAPSVGLTSTRLSQTMVAAAGLN